MNNLNSIIMDGEVKSIKGPGEFVIISHHKDRDTSILVKTKGKLAEVCDKHLSKGRGLRVVGRIADDSGTVFIIGEHVEIKPEVNRG